MKTVPKICYLVRELVDDANRAVNEISIQHRAFMTVRMVLSFTGRERADRSTSC